MQTNNTVRSYLKTFTYAFFAGWIGVIFHCIGNGDFDCLWHAKLGQYIVENKSIFSTDVFSWYAQSQGYTEFAHSWLGSVILYLFSTIKFPEIGFTLYCCLCAAILYIVIDRLFLKDREYYGIVAAVLCGFICYNPRPQSLSYSLFVIMIYLLYRTYSDSGFKGYWLFIPLTILLANIHGGTIPMLIGFEGVFFCLALCPNFSKGAFVLNRPNGDLPNKTTYLTHLCNNLRNFKQSEFLSVAKKMLICIGITLVSGLINPYGYKIYLYALGTNTDLHKKYISEWQPVSLGSAVVIAILILLLVTPAIKEKVDICKYIPVLLCFLLSAKMSRMAIYAILFGIILLEHITSKPIKKDDKSQNNLKKYMFVIITIFLHIVTGVIFYKELKVTKITMNSDIKEYLVEANYQRLYNSVDYGSIMIYNDIPCFVDTRGDLYDGEMFAESCEFDAMIISALEQPDEFIEKYDFDGMLILNKRINTIRYMNNRPDYEIDFQNDNITIYKKVQ